MRPLPALVSLFVVGVAVAAEPDKDGFVPLFNGKDLTGWVPVNVHPKTFFVKDGEIITTGQPIGYMRSEKQYENFILEMEWMHVNKHPVVGNSGLFIWGDELPVTGSPFTRGIEVQVLVNLEYKDKKSGAVTATSHGDVFAIQGATCKPDRPHPNGSMRCLPSEYRAKGGGEWNHYRVEAKDGVIKLSVNGKEVSGVSECKPRKGYLALESEGAECHFKNIKIKELPSSNPKPEEIAKAAEGHKLLFNGLDLDGWKVDEMVKADWTVKGGSLVAKKTDKVANPALYSPKSYEDIELIFDWKVPSRGVGTTELPICTATLRNEKNRAIGLGMFGDAALLLTGPSGDVIKLTAKPKVNLDGWNRAELSVKGTTVNLKINGQVVVKDHVIENVGNFDAGGGPINLTATQTAEFRNIFVRELK